MKLKAAKCKLMRSETKFLGRIVTREGIKPNPEAVEKIRKWLPPRNKKELESFMGLANYYREFVKDYASYADPLNKLRKKNVEWHWNQETQKSL